MGQRLDRTRELEVLAAWEAELNERAVLAWSEYHEQIDRDGAPVTMAEALRSLAVRRHLVAAHERIEAERRALERATELAFVADVVLFASRVSLVTPEVRS